MIVEIASLVTFLASCLIYYRLFHYDKWEAANSRIAKLELSSVKVVPYDQRETAIFEIV